MGLVAQQMWAAGLGPLRPRRASGRAESGWGQVGVRPSAPNSLSLQGRSWITCLPGRKFISTVGADLSQEWVQGGAGVPRPLGPLGPLHPNKPTLAASPPVASPSRCPALLAPPPSSQATHVPPEHLWPGSHCLLPLIPGLRSLGGDGGLGFSGHRELGSGLCKRGKLLAMAAAEVNPTPLSPILVTTDKAQLGRQ